MENILSLSVEDNGIGMVDKQVENENKFGITGMKERAYICGGNLTVLSPKMKGTKILLTIPLE
jgi:two-component system, NarL family, sensor histidine kinase UhpB